jgi:GxxExxY protein
MTLRIQSPLSDEIELIIERIIGCAIEVHRRLGPGFVEGIYEDAMTIELEAAGLAFDRQREIVIHYRDKPLRPQRIDLLVEGQIVVEVKAVEQLHSLHRAQLLSYARSARLQVGLLINFNGEVLKGNIRRVVI